MNRGVLCGVLLVVVSVTTPSQGEKIVISATPTIITPGETPELTVRCALEDDGNSGVSRVNSIVIRTADGSIQREVARIAVGQAATGGFSTTDATVTGDLSNKVGYLQVTWSSPRQAQAGQYNCDIVALATSGTNIKFKSSIQVVSTSKNEGGSDSSSQQCQCKDDIAALTKTVGDSQREIDYLKKTVNDLKTNIGGLSSVHIEEGIVSCTNSDSWGEKMKERERVVEVRFSTPYVRNPLVVVSPVVLDVEQSKNIRYRIGIRDVTPTGFKVVCGTWWDTILYRIDIKWTSSKA